MATLTGLLQAEAVPLVTVRGRYGPVLALIRKTLGVEPNAASYLEIWPTAFRTWACLAPNLLNLPFLMWGTGAPPKAVGLAMYASSRAAGCAYCSAHTCTFALRRGASAQDVGAALDDTTPRPPLERATIAVARSLARVPCDLSREARQELLSSCAPGDAEWIVLAVALMGFLNKFNDTIGVPLEAPMLETAVDVIGPSGWAPGKHAGKPAADQTSRASESASPPRADTLATKVSVLRHLPAAVALDRRWTAGTPTGWPAVGDYLRTQTGHAFPVLGRLRHRRAVRAIAAMVRDNLATATTRVGAPGKLLAGVVYAAVVGDDGLAADLRTLAAGTAGLDHAMVDQVAAFAAHGDAERLPVEDDRRAALLLARAASPSPAVITAPVADACRTLPPGAIVELVAWISVLQLLHRLSSFYAAE